jgi:hypothetical protein
VYNTTVSFTIKREYIMTNKENNDFNDDDMIITEDIDLSSINPDEVIPDETPSDLSPKSEFRELKLTFVITGDIDDGTEFEKEFFNWVEDHSDSIIGDSFVFDRSGSIELGVGDVAVSLYFNSKETYLNNDLFELSNDIEASLRADILIDDLADDIDFTISVHPSVENSSKLSHH